MASTNSTMITYTPLGFSWINCFVLISNELHVEPSFDVNSAHFGLFIGTFHSFIHVNNQIVQRFFNTSLFRSPSPGRCLEILQGWQWVRFESGFSNPEPVPSRKAKYHSYPNSSRGLSSYPKRIAQRKCQPHSRLIPSY